MLSLRSARPEDAAEVAAVHVRSWQVAYRGLLPDDYLAGLRPEDRMDRYTFGSTDPDAPWTTVAVENDAICGFATTGPCRDDDGASGELFALYVDPAMWGAGVGRRLLVEARAQLGRRRFTDGVLWVLVGNDRAQRFYAIDGWVPDERRRTEEIWGVSVDELCYRRHLP